MTQYRLGDDIDDYCVRCKRITNHSIVAFNGEELAKVRCRTCYADHAFLKCEAPLSKRELAKKELFEAVLKTVPPAAAPQKNTPGKAAKKRK